MASNEETVDCLDNLNGPCPWSLMIYRPFMAIVRVELVDEEEFEDIWESSKGGLRRL